ncbi:MAG: protein kinase [Acidobacteriota bacterium]
MAVSELSRYQALSKFGEGDEVALFRARDRSTGRLVALWLSKTRRPGRSILELASRMRHPRLVPILDEGEEEGVFHITQTWPKGRPLTELLEKGPLPVPRALRIVSGAASALTELHRHGEVHGNLCPWTLFETAEGEVEILGAGLGVLAGAPAYFSPERAQRKKLLPASDVFSLGAVLYEALSGFLPFPGESREEVLRSILYSPPPRMRVARPDLPPDAERLVLRCLAKAPSDRFQDADAFLNDVLDRAIERPSALLPQRQARSSRWWLFAAAVLALSVPAGVWYTLQDTGPTALRRDLGPYANWPRVAVMGPRYVGEDPSRQYLVQGIVDEIVSALTANTSLDVISTLSTRVYKDSNKPAVQIAEELAVDGLLESTLIEEPEAMRLHIRLADGKTGTYLWDHRLELSREDVYRIQNQVEGVLYAELEPLWLHTREHLHRAGTVEAYSLFLEGKQLFNRYEAEANRLAISKLQQALEKDPGFAPGWAALARAYANVVNVEDTIDARWLERADAASQKAVQLAPLLPDGYHARGSAKYLRYVYFGTGNRVEAENDFETALQLSPDFPDALLAKAFLLASRGIELDETPLVESSLKYYQRALALQPNLPSSESNYALALARTGQLELARARLERARSLNPASVQVYTTLGEVAFLQGDTERAIEATREALKRDSPRSAFHQSRLAAFYAAAGLHAEAGEILAKMQRGSPYEDFYLASALAGIGRESESLRKLQTWYQRMESLHEQLGLFRWWLRNDPNFETLRERKLLDRFGGTSDDAPA